MLERNLRLLPCCLLTKELKLDAEDAYQRSKDFSTDNMVQIIQASYVVDENQLPIEESKEKSTEIQRKPKETKNFGNFQKPKTGWRRYIGIFLILMATMTYSVGTLIIKMLNGYHPFVVSYIRYTAPDNIKSTGTFGTMLLAGESNFQGILIPAASLLLYFRFVEKKPIFDPIWPLTNTEKLKTAIILVIRSIVGCSSTICHIFALQYINLADASVIAFSCPVFVIAIAHVLGMEKMGYTSIFVTLLTLAGVGIICRPPLFTGASEFDTKMLIGGGLAFGSMLLASTVILILRRLRGVHFSLLMTSYGLFGTLECLIFALSSGEFSLPQGFDHWMLCLALVSFTFVAQISLIASLKYEEAGPVALIQTTDSIYSFLWQYLAFAVIPDVFSLSGAAVVIFGVAIISFKKLVVNLPEDNKTRQYFKFILK